MLVIGQLAVNAPPTGKQNVERFLFSVRNAALTKQGDVETVKKKGQLMQKL